jgi:hypothetical protein
VRGRDRLGASLAWLLCAFSLSLLILSSVLSWLLPVPTEDRSPLDATIEALGFVGIPVVGALIAARLPGNVYGWLWCATGLAAGLAEVAGPLVHLLGGPRWVGLLIESYAFVGLLALVFFVILLFPTGRLPTHRWRWVARAVVLSELLLVLVLPLVPGPSGPAAAPWAPRGAAARYLTAGIQVGVVTMFGLILVAILSVVFRFRRAGPVERRQLTWFMYAAVLNGVFLVEGGVLGVLGVLVDTALTSVGFLLLAAAVGIAVLRYRLYEIDRIVSRTVSYGALTGGLVALYLLVVTLLRPLLEPLTGSSALAVAGSTLAVAAVFNPARRRLQAVVDRRFDRARYDAARAVEAFAARLRNQVDLDEVTVGLRDTVAATVAPTRVALWLRVPSGRTGPEQ